MCIYMHVGEFDTGWLQQDATTGVHVSLEGVFGRSHGRKGRRTRDEELDRRALRAPLQGNRRILPRLRRAAEISRMKRIAILGDFAPENARHIATTASIGIRA
jgi:hypothetical protein